MNFEEKYRKDFIYLCENCLQKYENKLASDYSDSFLFRGSEINRYHSSVAEMFASFCIRDYLPGQEMEPKSSAGLLVDIRGAVWDAIPDGEERSLDLSNVSKEEIVKLKKKIQTLFSEGCVSVGESTDKND